MEIKKLISSKIFVAALVALSLFLGYMKFRQYQAQRAVENEKQKLAEQISSLESKNQELSDSLSYLNSSSFKERVARQQLNLKREGETVYSFGGDASPTQQPKTSDQDGSNFQKWLNYFFKNR